MDQIMLRYDSGKLLYLNKLSVIRAGKWLLVVQVEKGRGKLVRVRTGPLPAQEIKSCK